MAVAANVRMVCCPKCETFLPELPDFSVYKCGGCDAILKAKKNVILEDGLQKIADNVKGLGISETGSVIDAFEVPVESADGNERDREFIRNERVACDGCTTLPAAIGEVPPNSDVSSRGKERITRLEHLNCEYRSYSQGVCKRNQGINYDLNMAGCVNFHGEDTLESLRSRPVMDQWDVKCKGGKTGCRDCDLDGLARVENLENDRAELLRKIDELKDQLRSCDISEKLEGRIGADQRMISPSHHDPFLRHHAAYVQDGSTSSHVVNRQPLAPDEMAAQYLSRTSRFTPYADRYGSSLRDSYPQSRYTHEFLGYADRYHQEMFQRLPYQPQSQYMHQPYHHFHGYYDDENHENFFHQSTSCGHNYNKNWHLPSTVGPSSYNQRSRNEPSNPTYHHHLNRIKHGPQDYSSRDSNLHTLHYRQSINLNSIVPETDRFNHRPPRKVVEAQSSGQVWYPIAGGAPFLACSNCFESLKLPRKPISFEKTQQKMKCGACSSPFLFELRKKDFAVSVSAHIDDGSCVAVDDNERYWHGGSNSADMDACSKDYNESLRKFSPKDNKSNSAADSEKKFDPFSSNFSFSEDEQIPKNLASGEHGFSSEEIHLREVESLPHPDLSSDECPDHSFDDIVVNQFDQRNESKRSVFDQSTSRQNSVKDAAVTIEMDCVSQDSMNKSKEDHQMVNTGAESFFVGLIKKGFRD